MIWGPRLKTVAIETGDIAPTDVALADLAFFLASFSPGLYEPEPLFPFEALEAYYQLALVEKATLNGTDVDVIEGTTRDSKLRSGSMRLPPKVRCYVSPQGFIFRIDSLGADDSQQGFVEYRNAVFNEGINPERFVYAIPKDAFVMDIVRELESSGKHKSDNEPKPHH